MNRLKSGLLLLLLGVAISAFGFWLFDPNESAVVCASRCAKGDIFGKVVILAGIALVYYGARRLLGNRRPKAGA